jgi:hypothetical protein
VGFRGAILALSNLPARCDRPSAPPGSVATQTSRRLRRPARSGSAGGTRGRRHRGYLNKVENGEAPDNLTLARRCDAALTITPGDPWVPG